MIEWIMWVISFFTLYMSIVWLNLLFFTDFTRKQQPKDLPSLTIAVPAYNEENGICDTLDSLAGCDYPKDLLKIIVVDDGSIDGTRKKVESFITAHPGLLVSCISQENQGKAAAVNAALERCDTEFFACLDADSMIEKASIPPMMAHFEGSPKTAAVISAIKVHDPQNIYEKVQRLEYLIAILMRKIKSTINTLSMTPGVLSIYRTNILKEVGGFDVGNITEDFEIAMRLKYHGYNIQLEMGSVTRTKVPDTFNALWHQRLRWFRGYLVNHYKYRDMFFSRKHNRLFSCFQLPLNIFSIFMLLLIVGVVSYGSVTFLFERMVRLVMIKGYINHLFYLPDLKGFLLSYNFKIMFPLMVGAVAGIFLFWLAHRILKEKFRYPLSIWAYFAIFPYMSFTHWVFSIAQEVMRMRRKW